MGRTTQTGRSAWQQKANLVSLCRGLQLLDSLLPATWAGGVEAGRGIHNRVNFVAVAIYGQMAHPGADWDIYPMLPYDTRLENAPADVGLIFPYILLVDADANIICDGEVIPLT